VQGKLVDKSLTASGAWSGA